MTSILFGIVRICSSLFKCNYIKNKKLFINVLFHLWNLHQILNIFEKKVIGIADVFSKLQNVKSLVKPLSRKCCFRTSFHSQRVNGCQTLLKSSWENFYHIHFAREIIWKISVLLNFEILPVFVNTLTADDKHPVWDCENLQFPIQMQWSQKQKSFCEFFVQFMKSSWNFQHFRKKDKCDS